MPTLKEQVAFIRKSAEKDGGVWVVNTCLERIAELELELARTRAQLPVREIHTENAGVNWDEGEF